MKQKYIFATDVDGTMLMDNGLVHPFTLNSFKQSKENGHINVIATGRCVVRTLPLLEKNPYIDYFVCNNGAVVYDVNKKECVVVHGVNPRHYIKIIEFARKHNVVFKLHTDKEWIGDVGIEDSKPTILTPELDKNIQDHIKNNPDDRKLFNYQIPTQISINASADFCAQHIQEFIDWFSDDSSVYLTNSIYIDVNPKNKSKWTGLLEIAKLNNVNSNNIVTFGDSGNDLEMLLEAKENGYALANSKAELIKHIKPKIGSNNTDAIGKTILTYINKK